MKATSDPLLLNHLSVCGPETFQSLPCRYGSKAVPITPILRDMALCHVTLPPNSETEGKPNERCHYHKRMTELYCFLSGSGEILLNGTWCTVCPGSVVAVPPMTYHTVRSGVNGISMLVWTCPAYHADDSFSLTQMPEHGFAPCDPACNRRMLPEVDRGDLTLSSFYKSTEFYLGLASLESEASIGHHKHDGEEEAYYILEGTAEVTIGNTTAWVTPGTYVSIPKRVCHGITAGREGVRYYVAASPPVKTRAVSGAEVVFECLANLPLGGF